MKFLADMGISLRIVENLNSSGYDAIHVSQIGMVKSSDRSILEKAKNENRIVLTHDLDFGHILAACKELSPSVIIFRLNDMRPHNVEQYLFELIKSHSEFLKQGIIVSVNEKKTRIRQLPIES